jgi:hypothetical protein
MIRTRSQVLPLVVIVPIVRKILLRLQQLPQQQQRIHHPILHLTFHHPNIHRPPHQPPQQLHHPQQQQQQHAPVKNHAVSNSTANALHPTPFAIPISVDAKAATTPMNTSMPAVTPCVPYCKEIPVPFVVNSSKSPTEADQPPQHHHPTVL